jgi:hypothetical protein
MAWPWRAFEVGSPTWVDGDVRWMNRPEHLTSQVPIVQL